jgi:hypothetical protein
MDGTTVTLVNQLTLAAAAMIACGVLWRAYKGAHDAHVKDLQEFIREGISDVRARIMVIEDRDGIKRSERFQYMPPANKKERDALDNLDMTPAHQFSDQASERDK